MKYRIIFDTNTQLSAVIKPDSIPAKAFDKALDEATICFSTETLLELIDVFGRKKFDKYVTPAERKQFINETLKVSEIILAAPLSEQICRDPKDDKFLSLALASEAKIIVSGDSDLLVLNPFNGIIIITAAEYLKLQ